MSSLNPSGIFGKSQTDNSDARKSLYSTSTVKIADEIHSYLLQRKCSRRAGSNILANQVLAISSASVKIRADVTFYSHLSRYRQERLSKTDLVFIAL